MGRLEWLRWVLRHGTPNTRLRQVRLFFAYEFYRACAQLCGYDIPRWLDDWWVPAGRYLVIRRTPPLPLRLLDRVFPFGDEVHVKHVPYTPELAEERRKKGEPVEVKEISYVLGGGR